MRTILSKNLLSAPAACPFRQLTTSTRSLKQSEMELAPIRTMLNKATKHIQKNPTPFPDRSRDRPVNRILSLLKGKSHSQVLSARSEIAPIQGPRPLDPTSDVIFLHSKMQESLDALCSAKDSSGALLELTSMKNSQKRAAMLSLSSNNFKWMLQQICSDQGAKVATNLVIGMLCKTKTRPLDKYLLHSAIVVMLKNYDMDEAFRLWNLLDTFDVPAQPWLYTLAIKQFVFIGKVDQAIHMYNAMKNIDDAPIDNSAGLLLRAMLRERLYDGIEQIADDLCDVLTEPADPQLLELLLNAYSKAGNIPRMQDMCSHLVDQGIQPRGPIISIIISAYMKNGMRDEALDMVDLLLQTNDKMDDKIQRILISTILQASGPKDARQLLDLLESHKLMRSCRCHIIMSSAYARVQQHEKVAEMFDRAEELGLQITPPFYTLAINSALKLNNLSRAKTLLSRCESFLDKGEMRKETFYTLQLHLHSREGRHHKVKYLWDTELKHSASRSVALSLYIDSAGHNCKASTVVYLWKSLEADGYDLNNENLINSYLEALLRTGHHDLALQAFKREFQERNITPTTKTLITVLQPLAMKQNIALIRKLKAFIFHTYPSIIPAWQSVQEVLEDQLKNASTSNHNINKRNRKGR